LAGSDAALEAGAAGAGVVGTEESSGFAVDGAGLAEAEAAVVADAVEGEDGDMGTNSASPKSEVARGAS
jgi:hypothetical protein